MKATKKTVPSLFLGTPAGSYSLVSESGLYKLVMRSDKPEAKPFQNWVTKVVLPAIRSNYQEQFLGERAPEIFRGFDSRVSFCKLTKRLGQDEVLEVTHRLGCPTEGSLGESYLGGCWMACEVARRDALPLPAPLSSQTSSPPGPSSLKRADAHERLVICLWVSVFPLYVADHQ